MDENRKRKPYGDPFDHFVKDMIDLLKKMDEDLSKFINGDITAWDSSPPLGDEPLGEGYPSDSGDEFGIGRGGAPLELEEQGIDVIELDEEIIIVVDAPGVRKENISVRVKGRDITIKAGEFLKKLHLPINIDPKRTKATYRNGILEVRIPKR